MERHGKPLQSFSNGLRVCGHDIISCLAKDHYIHISKADMVVIFGSGSKNRGINALYKFHIIEACTKHCIPYVMLEEAFIKRGEYWSATVNGLAGDGEYLHEGLDENRIDGITKFKPFNWHNGYILISKQLERDANVNLVSGAYDLWFRKVVARYKKFIYPIVVREHPKNKKPTCTIKEALRRARYLVTYTSTSAVDAVLSGVPFTVAHARSIVYKLRTELNEDLPTYEYQRKILNEVAHAQWTLDEMDKGVCWDYMKSLKKIACIRMRLCIQNKLN